MRSFDSALLALSLAAGAVACTARPIDFGETSGSSADGGDDQGTATVGTTATSTGMPTPPDPTTTGTTGPDPTDTGPDPSTTDPTDSGPWLDVMPPDPWPDIPLDACAAGWGPGTWVEGVSPWGDLFGNRAWNAMVDPWQPGMLRIVVLGKNADVEKNLEEAKIGGLPVTGPAVVVDTGFPFPEWIGGAQVPALMLQDGNAEFAMVEVEVFDRLGNWETWDPEDPPRVRGYLSWVGGEPFGFDGQFDAAYCGAFTEIQIAE